MKAKSKSPNKPSDLNMLTAQNKIDKILPKGIKIKKGKNISKISSVENINIKGSSDSGYKLPMLSYPKNVNDYAHIIKKNDCHPSDVEFLLLLRTFNKPKKTSENLTAPNYYEEDLEKYRKRHKKTELDKTYMRTNYSTYSQLFHDRSKLAINDSQYKYEVSLRIPSNFNRKKASNSTGSKKEDKKDVSFPHKSPWNPTQFYRGKNLFGSLLPPVLQMSKNNLSKIQNYLPHPVKQINRSSTLNNDSIHQRIFEYNNDIILRYPSEINITPKYTNLYGVKNFNLFRHVNDKKNTETTYTKWVTSLRPDKYIKYTINQIRKQESKVKKMLEDKEIK